MVPTELQCQERLVARISQAIQEATYTLPPRAPTDHDLPPPEPIRIERASIAALRAANDIISELVQWAGPLRGAPKPRHSDAPME